MQQYQKERVELIQNVNGLNMGLGSTPLTSNVQFIPARRRDNANLRSNEITKKRVCAYCRVSTEEESQATSYELQVSHYTEFIKKNSAWEFVGIFADEGISGTSVKKRLQFQKMIQECLDGKIDYIITKSISRFARNTLDCLTYVRELKNLERPVGIYFEKENIDTLDSKSELILTILSSVAQDESRSISENTKWGVQKRFQQGKAHCPTTYFMGYDTDENGKLVINEDEAKIIRRIYKEFIGGKGSEVIARGLMEDKVVTVRGNFTWTSDRIIKILKNEKYCGDILMQKSITVDFLTHRRIINKGHEQQYFIADHHPAIIPKEEWYAVQQELRRRYQMFHDPDNKYRQAYSGKCVFSNKFFCAECGRPVARRRLTSQRNGEKYLFSAWQCKVASGHDKDFKGCRARYIRESSLEAAFMKMLYELKKNRDEAVAEAKVAIDSSGLTDIENIRLAEVESQYKAISNRLNEMAKSSMVANADIYEATMRQLTYEQDLLQDEWQNLMEKKQKSIEMERQLQVIIKLLEELEEEPEDYDKYYEENKYRDDIFSQCVEKGFMHDDGKVDFELKCGITRTAQAFIRIIKRK